MSQETIYISGDSTQCHICNMAIPNLFIFDHIKSAFHLNNLQIMDIILQRSKNYIKSDNYVMNSDEQSDDEFCDICCVSYSYVHKIKHKTSDQHKKFITFDKLLPKICILLKDVSNNLHVIDEMEEILNKEEKPIDNVISYEDSITSNISEGTHKNVEASTDKIETDFKLTKGKSIAKARCVTTDVQKYYENNLEDYKETEEAASDDNKQILIEKTSEMIIESNKTNHNQDAIDEKPIDMTYSDNQTTFKAFDGCWYKDKTIKPKVNVHKAYCDVCNSYRQNISIHSKSKKHKKKVFKKILNGHHIRTYITDTLRDGVKYCKICKVILDFNKIKEHTESDEHLNRYKRIVKDFNITKVGNDYFCPACNVFEHDVVKHIIENHKTPFLFPYETFCDVCRIKLPTSNLKLHLRGKLHVGNQQCKKEKQFKYICMYINDIDCIKDMITLENSGIKCKVCNVYFYDVPPLTKHMKSDKHRISLRELYYDNNIQILPNNILKCNFCNTKVTNALEHIYSMEHEENVV